MKNRKSTMDYGHSDKMFMPAVQCLVYIHSALFYMPEHCFSSLAKAVLVQLQNTYLLHQIHYPLRFYFNIKVNGKVILLA